MKEEQRARCKLVPLLKKFTEISHMRKELKWKDIWNDKHSGLQ